MAASWRAGVRVPALGSPSCGDLGQVHEPPCAWGRPGHCLQRPVPGSLLTEQSSLSGEQAPTLGLDRAGEQNREADRRHRKTQRP